ncbi:MAG: thymidylate synthase [Coriobacteriales bacterium]|jgi:thymidylate synthase|nr:thymidylate synthase [Coriobacteriales bacterium]
MKDVFVEGRTLPEVYHAAILRMFTDGQLADCEDWAAMMGEQQRECRMTLHIEEPTAEPRMSKLTICGPRELRQYELEVLDGIMDFAVDVTKEDGTPLEDYTYSWRMHHPFDQVRFVLDDLRRSASSRRAIIGIRDNDTDHRLQNPACLQNLQFFIRDGKLDCCVMFRSNDFAQAFFMNAWAFIRLQERLAAKLGVGVGTYSHTSNSMHVYGKSFGLFEGYVEQIRARPHEELCYDYEDLFKDMMEEYDAEIAAGFARVRAAYGLE